VGRALGVGAILRVGVGLTVAVGVGVGEPACAQYLPPVFKCTWFSSSPPRRSFHCRSILPCVATGQRARW